MESAQNTDATTADPGPAIAPQASGLQLAHVLHGVILGLVAKAGPDLSARQIAIFLTCQLAELPFTVRGLSAQVGISKVSICQGLARLEELGLLIRQPDPADRRSVLIKRTLKGAQMLAAIRKLTSTEAEALRD